MADTKNGRYHEALGNAGLTNIQNDLMQLVSAIRDAGFPRKADAVASKADALLQTIYADQRLG